ISRGTLTHLAQSVGDKLKTDEEVATIETEKIDIAVHASESGRPIELHVAEGDEVVVGQEIATGATDYIDEQTDARTDKTMNSQHEAEQKH
ncbi:hypothetical protein BKA66DRAFT_435332, partial [Pyrenochaeta sp. MPI-SDFR-AT-0127]